MATVDFTLDDLKKVLATKEDLRVFATKDDLKTFPSKDDLNGFATKDDLQAFATKDDVCGIVHGEIAAERVYTKQLIQESANEVRGDIKALRVMLEQDAKAESKRLDKVDRRSLKTQKMLKEHLAA